MKRAFAAILVVLLATAPWPVHAAVEVGMKAPLFEAESTMGPVKLSDYLGEKNVLLAVYYKDFTSG